MNKNITEMRGLSKPEVEQQIKLGNINTITVNAGQSVKEIIIRNTMTLFNLLNLTLAVVVIAIGSYKNTLFILSVIINTGVGIYQEIKAKRIIEKLSILTQNKVEVIRDGQKITINKEKIVVNDLLCLTKGMQVPVDTISLENGLYVDESMITGESDIVEKKVGDLIYSGCLVLQGQIKTQVQSVGNNTFVSKLTSEAKSFKDTKSKIQQYIDKILKIIMIAILPVTALVLLNQFFLTHLDLSIISQREIAILGSAAVISSLIPEGLVLLTSVALAAGVIKLSKKQVLAQNLSAIETLARVDVLCLDKTGTITEGKMNVEEVLYYTDNKEEINNVLSFIVEHDTEQNASIEALKNKFGGLQSRLDLVQYIPFSSEIKQQAIEIKDKGVYTLGAFDMISNKLENQQKQDIEFALKRGYRILGLAHSWSPLKDKTIPKDTKIICLIFLKDKPKKEAKKILEYFERQGTEIKIISGDHPETVLNIAHDVGIKGSARNLNELPKDAESLQKIAEETTVFGRITPERKRDLITALQSNGHTVAMIGDGINDILALKKSDCAIALGSGNEATKSVAQFVLLENDFSVLPSVVQEGRKVINNIKRVAGMNLLRVIYTFVLIILLVITRKIFPLESINLMLMGIFTVGVPSALLILEKDEKPSTDDFFKRIIVNIVPAGILIGITIFTMLILPYKFPLYSIAAEGHLATNYGAYLSDVTLIIGSVQLFALYLLCRPLSRYRASVIVGMTLVFYTTYFIPPITKFLGIAPLQSSRFIIPTLICIALLLIVRMLILDGKKVNKLKLSLLCLSLMILLIFASAKLRQFQKRMAYENDKYIQVLPDDWYHAQRDRNS
ncbi:HAD-IC family P-type ATPase [Lactococcus protaetiae]|uniref:HAD-IC family P-type ATPase n=1 Tax=Lactococcus protaetiae TaxID=2592653 RepID=A0A514Z9Z0_9LACT|nr:HAD-IC family P-type ATPase [Lactococcus protaetiae]QDK71404.1 HAD-IC family P-type ATPase [Lactococcus protaetiae]